MKMDLRELLLVFTMMWNMSYGLRCYKCKPQREDYRDHLCEHFDYSDKYLIDCADSTMCYKKEIIYSLGNGLKLFERDCAKQILNGDQVRTSHGWDAVKRIYEPCQEGCKEIPEQEKVTKTVHCYCRGDLCNGAGVNIGGLTFVAALVMLTRLI